jgi:toxin ParE1/3/4
MAYRVKFSRRALHELGKAHDWYESKSVGLGFEFSAAVELQILRVAQAPQHFAEIIPKVRRALLPRFPYGIFFAVRGDLVHVLATLHEARNPKRWPIER